MRKIITISLVVLLCFIVWFLCIKPYDYLVTFKAKTTVGTVNQSLKIWNKDLKNTNAIVQEDIHDLMQKISFNDSVFHFNWRIEPVNDSLSKVNVYVSNPNNSLKNRVLIPFLNSDFEKRTKNTVVDFVNKLKEHLKRIKISAVKKSKTKATYCAYVTINGLQISKARGMMQYYSQISGILLNNKVKFNGTPFVEVTNWDMAKDSITYNFCFPIFKKDTLPKHPLIKYKHYKSVKALKTIYNGNYITSDRAWYKLLEYAKQKNIKVHKTPIEVFYNNPNFGGDELRWKAEVYMPLKE